jgi:hypothetical protein
LKRESPFGKRAGSLAEPHILAGSDSDVVIVDPSDNAVVLVISE